MNESAALVEAVVALSKMNQQLEDAGGPEGEGDLFEEYLAARVNILEKFGLPETEEFLFLLASGAILTDTEAEEVVTELHQAATRYLLSPVRQPRFTSSRSTTRTNSSPPVRTKRSETSSATASKYPTA